MSLLFKPRIPFNFGAGHNFSVKRQRNNVSRERLLWSEEQLETLICLRALRFTFEECGEHFGRSGNAFSNIIVYRQLKGLIKEKRDELVKKVVKNDC